MGDYLLQSFVTIALNVFTLIYTAMTSLREVRVHTFQVNSKLLPKAFPREFDAHIYFTGSQEKAAAQLRIDAQQYFSKQKVFVGELIPIPIGPHSLPMFEINFPREAFADVVLWLMHNRKDLNVLVHELAGDDYDDHTSGALWLGSPVPLKLDVLK